MIFPLNQSGDAQRAAGSNATTHAVVTPRVSKRPTRPTSKAAGPRWVTTRPTVARACRCGEPVLLKCSTAPTRPGPCTRPDPRRLCRLGNARNGRAEGHLPAQDDQWRVDRHHVPDRTALRHRPGADAHQGRTQPDGTYKITGNKIFISAGEHDMSDNIIHLVLARLPDAPPASRA